MVNLSFAPNTGQALGDGWISISDGGVGVGLETGPRAASICWGPTVQSRALGIGAGDATGMDGAMAQDNNRLDAQNGETRPEPSLSLPTEGSALRTAEDASEPPFEHAPPQRTTLPPPLPKSSAGGGSRRPHRTRPSPRQTKRRSPTSRRKPEPADTAAPRRRMARRRPAGPSRNRVAANDDGPSIGGLIFALQQKPSNAPFKFAAIASIVWAAIGTAFALVSINTDAPVLGWLDLRHPPHDVSHRRRHLRAHRASVADGPARLAHRRVAPQVLDHDRGRHSPRRARSLGRAECRHARPSGAPPGRLHERRDLARARAAPASSRPWCTTRSRVLERSYEENERKIRGLISELSGERHALVNTSDRVTESLIRSAARSRR